MDRDEFLHYLGQVHERTMRLVRAIPPDRIEWTCREGEFTLGDLARHIAATERDVFAESLQIFRGMSDADLAKKGTSPQGVPITAWKLLRSMVEHEAHHRGQIYVYLGILGVKTPSLFGLNERQLEAVSRQAAQA
jgi:uncharacterized damage-inducible protein DinB